MDELTSEVTECHAQILIATHKQTHMHVNISIPNEFRTFFFNCDDNVLFSKNGCTQKSSNA